MGRIMQEIITRDGYDVKIPTDFNKLPQGMRAKMVENYVGEMVAQFKQADALRAITVLKIDAALAAEFNGATGLEAEIKVSQVTDKPMLVCGGVTIFKAGRTWEDAVVTLSAQLEQNEKENEILRLALPYAKGNLERKAKELAAAA